MWLILAVVELCCSTQFLIFLSLSEVLQLRQVAWKLVAIQCTFDLKTNALGDACGAFGGLNHVVKQDAAIKLVIKWTISSLGQHI